MNHQAPRSWNDVRILQDLADQGDEDAEFWVENSVLWQFDYLSDLYSLSWQPIS